MTTSTTDLAAALVESGLDFIQSAAEELTERQKYSVVHFAIGVELLIKARLMEEHWTLVVEDPGSIGKQDFFKKGDFKSVSLKQAIARLNRVTSRGIRKVAADSFLAVTRHRNQVVHFWHPALANNDAAAEIAVEQCRAWIYLQELLKGEWSDAINIDADAVERVHNAIRRNRSFLKAKYLHLKPSLEKSNADITVCRSCGFEASVVSMHKDGTTTSRCLVCDFREHYLEYECPECGETNRTYPEISTECDDCGEQNESWIFETLLKVDDDAIAMCSECQFYQGRTVHQRLSADGYTCVNCLATFDDYDECEYCGEPCAGIDLAYSYLRGCIMCDGRDLDD